MEISELQDMDTIKDRNQVALIEEALRQGREALRKAVDERRNQQQVQMHSFAFRF
jgi:hypothetical protein